MKTSYRAVLAIAFLCLFLASFSLVQAQGTVSLDREPSSIEGFMAMRNQIATTAEGGAAMFLLALKIYAKDQDLGTKCLVATADKSTLTQSQRGYKGYTLRSWYTINSGIGKNTLIPNSYIKGSSPENGYSVSLPYQYVFTTNRYSGDKSEGKIKLFVNCSGASSARPMHIKRNSKGIWKVTNWSSVVVGIAKASTQEEIDDI